jgi:hypothetical protein
MLEKLDAKFYGEIRKVKNDTLVPDDCYMVFLAHDNVFALVLPIYRMICAIMGCDAEHIAAVDRTIERLHAWREQHPDKCKNPDAKGEKLLDQRT